MFVSDKRSTLRLKVLRVRLCNHFLFPIYFQKLDSLEAELITQNAKIDNMRAHLRQHIAEYGRLKTILDATFTRLNDFLTTTINAIVKEDCRYNIGFEFQFQFDYKKQCETEKMIVVKNGGRIATENIAFRDQIEICWLIFAAFHEYSHAPFVFIDLSDVSEEVITIVCAIVKRISSKSQLFINSSHVHHIGFANLQYAVNKKVHSLRFVFL